MRLVRVRADQIAQAWPLAQPLMARAVAQCGDWTMQDLVLGLEDKSLLLWLAVDDCGVRAAAATLLREHVELGRTLTIVACGGDDCDWPALLGGIECHAREIGCDRLRISGRRGWARVFRDYHEAFVTIEKAL